MAAQLSNIAQFCDDLAFVIAGRGSAQNAADRVIAFRRHGATEFRQQIDRKDPGRDTKITCSGEQSSSDTVAA